jgi:hypothetical protein
MLHKVLGRRNLQLCYYVVLILVFVNVLPRFLRPNTFYT